jgi:hypothetical protein
MKTEQEMNTSQGKHSMTGYHLYIYPLGEQKLFPYIHLPTKGWTTG